MLALSSPHLLSTTYRWPLDNIIAQNLTQDFNDIISTEFEANSYHSLLDLPTYDHIQQDFVPENSISKSSGGVQNASIGDPKKVAKKLDHNASERYRRKRVNDLYSFLRSVLPTSGDQKRKESIPRTVSRALKYIPELQKEVETLSRRKEKLLSHPSSTANTSQDSFGVKKQSVKERKPSVVSSVSVLGEKEAVIQLIFSADHKDIGFLSKILEYLEQEEEDGLVLLINSTTFFKCLGEGALVNTLHLQVQGCDKKIEAERLKAKLCSFYQQ